MLRHHNIYRVAEYGVWISSTVGEKRCDLRLEGSVRSRVQARCSEVEINELEHRLDVLRRARRRHALLRFTERRRDAHSLSTQLFAEVDCVERSNTAE